MAFKLAISAGHYLKTQKGCIKALDPNETREWVLNDRIADKLEAILKKYDGIEVLRLDDTNGVKDVTNTERTQKANEWGADFYLAIHHNAAGGDGKPHNASGICAFVYTNPSAKSVEWAQALYDASVKHTGLKGNRSQAVWKANFEEVRAPKMPAVLMENGFMDSPTDVPIILSEEYADGIARAYAEVVVAESGATLKKSAENVFYRIQVGAFSLKAYAEAFLKKVKAAGFSDAFITTAKVEGKVVYRIQVGAFSAKANANAYLAKVKAAGFTNAFIVTVGKVDEKEAFAVGDKVKLTSNAVVYGTNKKFASWVYDRKLYVRKINGNKITVSTLKIGATTGVVDKKYLVKA